VPLFIRLWQRIYLSVATLSWAVLGTLFFGHALICYILFAFAGEEKLTQSVIAFVYFYMTTATTVGYGDLSPGSDAGRLVNVLVVFPGAIALFTILLGKAIASISAFWRRSLQGLGDYSKRTKHTLVVGWQGARHADRAVARQRSDLKNTFCAAYARDDLKEFSLYGRDAVERQVLIHGGFDHRVKDRVRRDDGIGDVAIDIAPEND
jgi:hypothetical protein